MKVETKIQLEQSLKNDARKRIKDRINEKMEKQIKLFQNKNKTRNEKDINKFHRNTRTFNTIYLTIILKSTLIHNISLTPK